MNATTPPKRVVRRMILELDADDHVIGSMVEVVDDVVQERLVAIWGDTVDERVAEAQEDFTKYREQIVPAYRQMTAKEVMAIPEVAAEIRALEADGLGNAVRVVLRNGLYLCGIGRSDATKFLVRNGDDPSKPHGGLIYRRIEKLHQEIVENRALSSADLRGIGKGLIYFTVELPVLRTIIDYDEQGNPCRYWSGLLERHELP